MLDTIVTRPVFIPCPSCLRETTLISLPANLTSRHLMMTIPSASLQDTGYMDVCKPTTAPLHKKEELLVDFVPRRDNDCNKLNFSTSSAQPTVIERPNCNLTSVLGKIQSLGMDIFFKNSQPCAGKGRVWTHHLQPIEVSIAKLSTNNTPSLVANIDKKGIPVEKNITLWYNSGEGQKTPRDLQLSMIMLMNDSLGFWASLTVFRKDLALFQLADRHVESCSCQPCCSNLRSVS
jgi:hypothetical protein